MSSVIISGDTSGAVTLTVPAVAGTNTVTIPSTTGTVMVSGNMPAFFAYPSTPTTLTAAADVKITLDTELFDTNNNFSSSRFTPTVAGYYQVNGIMTVNYWTGTILICYIMKNGSYYAIGNSGYPQSTGGVHVTVSAVVYMNGTTDYLELYGFNYAATSSNVVSTGQAYTNFSGALVRSA
jgi:hypothetical protein